MCMCVCVLCTHMYLQSNIVLSFFIWNNHYKSMSKISFDLFVERKNEGKELLVRFFLSYSSFCLMDYITKGLSFK